MKNLLLIIFSVLLVMPAMAQDKVKVRFKLGKNTIFVNKVAWAKVEYTAGKYFLKTLSGEDFASIKPMEYGTGRYFKNTGNEIMHSYCEITFLDTDIEAFEVDANYNEATRLMYQIKVLESDKFIKENALKFKERYSDNVSEKHFLTK